MYASCFMIFSAFLYSIQNLFIKLSMNHNIGVIGTFRGICGIIVTTPYFIIKRQYPICQNKFNVLLFSMLSMMSILLQFQALLYIDLAISTTIVSITPVWTAIFCYLLKRKDQWHYLNSIGTLICLIGVSLLTYRNYKINNWIGIMYSLSSSVFTGALNIISKDIPNDEIVIYIFYSMMSLCLVCPFLIQNIILHDYFIYPMGFSSVFALLFKTLAIQLSSNLGVILLRYLDIIFSIIWDIFILSKHLTRYEYFTMTLIFIGSLIRKY